MSNSLDIIRVRNDTEDLQYTVPAGSILYNMDTGEYYLMKRSSVPGDTLVRLLRQNMVLLLGTGGSAGGTGEMFQGDVDVVGGVALNAIPFDQLPDISTNNVDLVGQYWDFAGPGNTLVDLATPQIGVDLDGVTLNTGDRIQIMNRGSEAAPNLHWVTRSQKGVIPTNRDQMWDFSWIPGQSTTSGAWRDGRGGIAVAADEAALLAFTAPEDITVGSLVLQEDTGVLYMFSPAGPIQPGQPTTRADWKPLPYRIVMTTAERMAMTDPEDLTIGSMIADFEAEGLFVWAGPYDPTSKFSGWMSVMSFPSGPMLDRRLRFVYDPEIPNVAPSHEYFGWQDDRQGLQTVRDERDLSDRTVLPLSHIDTGKLVFVRSEGLLYELIADPTTLVNDLSDWKPLVGGATYVGRISNLPDPNVDNLVDGQQFVVRMDLAGEELLRLVSWDDSMAAVPAIPITVTVTPGATTADPLTIEFDSGGQQTAQTRRVSYDLTFGGVQTTGNIPIPAGEQGAGIAKDVAQALTALGIADLTVTQVGKVVTLTPSAAQTIDAAVVDMAPVAQGGWRYLNRHVWTKAGRAANDQASAQQPGDLQVTLEKDHKELKVYDGTAWQMIHSDDEIATQIASLSLFEGTAKELGGAAIGAIELDHLPNLWTMESMGDFGKVSHYWVYVGAAGYEVKSPAQEKADAVAAGDSWGDVRVTTTPANLPAAAGTAVDMKFEVLDAAGQPGGQIEVDKTLTLRFEVDDGGTPQFHEMRFNLIINPAPGIKLPMDADAVASLVFNTWQAFTPVAVPGQPAPVQGHVIGMTAANLNADTVTFQPDPTVAFSLFHSIDGGTPGIGEDLSGAILNPGDWIQVARDTSQPAGSQMHYVTVGGDLLTKNRADGLYSLQAWVAGSYEQGSLVNYKGDVYRATQDIMPSAGDPVGTPTRLSLTPGAIAVTLGTQTDVFPAAAPADGALGLVSAPITVGAASPAFVGMAVNQGDTFIYSTDASVAGTGQTIEGYPFDHGWLYLGKPAVVSNPLNTQVAAANTGWAKVDISGGLKIAQTDADLPAVAPSGQVWIVLQSAKAGGQGLYAYDPGTQRWDELGGGGKPLDLSKATDIIYPNAYYADMELPAALTDPTVPQPKIVGDTLLSRNAGGYPLLIAVSKDGATWTRLHPHRLTFDADGSNKVAKADYPMQFNIAVSGSPNIARITHVGGRNLDWVAMEGRPKYWSAVNYTNNAYSAAGYNKTWINQRFPGVKGKSYEVRCTGQIKGDSTTGHSDGTLSLSVENVAWIMRQEIEIQSGRSCGFAISGIFQYTSADAQLNAELTTEGIAHSIMMSGVHLIIKELT